MTKEVFEEIKAGLEDALAYQRGDTSRGIAYQFHDIDVRALRDRLGLSQAEFARQYRINLRVLQSWEQHDRRPDSTAQTLLYLIDKNPAFVRESLAT